jgi:hypothetical protein
VRQRHHYESRELCQEGLGGGRHGQLQSCAYSNGRKAQIESEGRGGAGGCHAIPTTRLPPLSLPHLVDISFVVGYVSRFLQCPTEEHMFAIKRILRFIVGTLHYGCFYTRGKAKPQLHGYSDFDLASDIDMSKSTSRGIFFLGDRPVGWHSLKQCAVALSSCEADYVTDTSAPTQFVWLA